MSSLSDRMPHTLAFPDTLGTGLLIRSERPCERRRADIEAFIEAYERALSRFREDSLVAAMRRAEHGGSFDFPDWALRLFELYDALAEVTQGAIDACVGEDLIRLGYDASYSFSMQADAGEHLGAVHGRATWCRDVERHGTTLITKRPVSLDFGACGKGYLVDLLATTIGPVSPRFVIDAGGDLLVRSPDAPIVIGLEDPADPDRAVGTASVASGAFCASAPSRRHWGEAAGHRLHHLLNAIDGHPADQVAASWTYVGHAQGAVASPTPVSSGQRGGNGSAQSDEPWTLGTPTALADGLATALFAIPPERLRSRFRFDCAVLTADRHAQASQGFPGTFFVT